MLDMIFSLRDCEYKHRFYFNSEPNWNAFAAWKLLMTGQPIPVPTPEELEATRPIGDALLAELGLTVKV